MRAFSKYPILTLTTVLVSNLLLAFFLIMILADGVLKYEVGFVVITPIIALIIYTLISTFIRYFKREHNDLRNIKTTIILIVLGLIILLFFLFNVACWIDLFDGKTNALLP